MKLSQAQLGERAGIQASAISHFETGARKPSYRSLRKLANALGVTTDFLLGRVDERTGSSDQVDQIYRDVLRLSAEDQDLAAQFIERLARQSESKKGEPDEEAED